MPAKDKIFIKDLMVQAILGVNKEERVKRQNINISIVIFHDIKQAALHDDVRHTINYSLVCKAVVAYTEDSHHYTLESLCSGIAKICCVQFGAAEAIVHVEKPCALSLARCPAVEVHRTRDFFLVQEPLMLQQSAAQAQHQPQPQPAVEVPPAVVPSPGKPKDDAAGVVEESSGGGAAKKSNTVHTAYLALGSNLGQREDNIYKALKVLAESCDIISTSALYQTPPAYVVDQPAFLNAACKIRTKLTPGELLDLVKSVEQRLGRTTGGIRFGPRCIDVDILFYDSIHIHRSDESLIIPHSRIPERDFVLGPLKDIAADYVHPILKKTIAQLFHELPQHKLYRVTPIRSQLWTWSERTFVMGVINATPDSFSDGGDFFDIETAVRHAKELVEGGAHILDIGGQSTNPRSTLLSAEEEVKRVVPLVQALRSEANCAWMKNIPISIDTFYSSVAEEAIKVGADVINDISGGVYDEKILSVAHHYQVPIVLMHMRGTPQTMMQPVNTDYGGKMLDEVARVLKQRADSAQLAGIPRWNIILDAGIGFAKTADHNLEILRRLKPLHREVGESYVMLVGASRKGFIGKIVGGEAETKPKLRGWGTAATSTAAVAGGANIIRVHDVKEQGEVIKVADAIYRNNWTSS